MKGLRLYKIEKLCSTTAIDALFARGGRDVSGAMAYPLRVMWRENTGRKAPCAQFLVSVPKKRLRHAVDRVTMRRRVREAYRLSRRLFPADRPFDIAFVYVADRLLPFDKVMAAMERLLRRIAASADAVTLSE